MAKSSKKTVKSAAKPTPSKKKTPSKPTKTTPKQLIRKVAAPASKTKPRSIVSANATRGGEPMTVSPHIYRITMAPPNCTDWENGDYVEVYVAEPPPPSITLMPGGACNGTTADLDE